MKAIVSSRYGVPSQLKPVFLPDPEPKPNELRIRIHFAAVNDMEWASVTGDPKIYRPIFGWRGMNPAVPGIEFSGVVDAVGKDVTDFKEGDAVFGDRSDHKWGTWCELACIKASEVQHKPEWLSFEHAACIPHAGSLARQGLKLAGLKSNQKVLINGAGGGVGSFAIQLAKLQNCHVTGVDSAAKREHMLALGCDKTIDYQETDFTQKAEKYDVILDSKTARKPSAYVGCLNAGGKYVTVGGKPGLLIRTLLASRVLKNPVAILAYKPNAGLEELLPLIQEGRIKPIPYQIYPLEEAAKALQLFGEGKHLGKVILRV